MHPVFRATVCMGAFGADTAKPTWLYSGHKWIGDIVGMQQKYSARARARGRQLTYLDEHGGVCGAKPDLKRSQAYPPAFGEAMHELYMAHRDGPIKPSPLPQLHPLSARGG